MVPRSQTIAPALGAVLVILLAVFGSQITGPELAAELERKAAAAIAETSAGTRVEADFAPGGWPTRHPLLSGGEGLNEGLRDRIAKTVAAVPGVGGIRWTDGSALVESSVQPIRPRHCQEDVEALLQARTIRFEESSARIDVPSRELIAEVAAALRPCLGSIIAITGHTDTSGPEPGNLALSRERAHAVRDALIARGIPEDGLRALGLGSAEPVPGLEPTDPANRRIEFSVLATEPVRPTPIDTPGPR